MSLSAVAMQRRLTAIQVLHAKVSSLRKERGNASNAWGKKEKDALAKRDALIEEAVPGAKLCRERLLKLQEAHARLRTIRSDKSSDLTRRATKIAEFEGFLNEVIAASLNDEQLPLDLGEKASIAEGLALTPGAIKAIGAAANEALADAALQDPEAEPDAEVQDLAGAIAAMGLEGFSLSSTPEAEAGEDAGEDAGEEPDDASEEESEEASEEEQPDESKAPRRRSRKPKAQAIEDFAF